MTSQERKRQFDEATALILRARQIVSTLQPDLVRRDDCIRSNTIVVDLAWAAENCTVMGLHQIGEAIGDTMGVTLKETDE